MTVLSTELTRTNRDLVVFCLVAAVVSGFLSASFALYYTETKINQAQAQQLLILDQRLDAVELLCAKSMLTHPTHLDKK